MKRRSGSQIMARLIGLVKPLAGYMVLAILMGLIGHLCAAFITICGGWAVLDVLGAKTPFSLTALFIAVIAMALVRGVLRYAEQSCNHFIAFKLLALIRDKVFGALRRLAPAKLEGRDKGDLINDVTCLYEVDEPLTEIPAMQASEVEDTIGGLVSELVHDGDTIQLGIGSLPDAVAHHLMDKHDLGLHTEMFTSSMGEMIRRGIITGERKNYYKGVHVGSFAGGDRALYDTMAATPTLRIVPGSYGVNPMTIMQNDNMVSINTILEMDLTGQVCSESIGPRQHSGSGGGFCFAYGALHSKGGRGILAFASRSKKGMPKIKPMLTQGAVVTIPRNYVDYIVTEYGVVQLRGCNVKERTEKLISIAHPEDRAELRREAEKLFYI